MSMYDQTLGQALNYGGQNMIPGKASSPMAETFLDSQVNNYGIPRQRTRATRQLQPTSGSTPWMPNGAPQPAPAQPAQPLAPTTTQQPAQVGQRGSVDAGTGIYTPGQAPSLVYQAQQIPQFQAPNDGGVGQLQQQSVMNLLRNPYSMGPDVLNQMKGQNRDSAVLMENQVLGQLRGSLAGRGIGLNEGMGLGNQRALMAATNADILAGNRGLDIEAAKTNRQDLLNALGVAGDYQQGLFSRALGGYGAQLQGLGANRDEGLSAIQSQLQNFGLNEDLLQRQSGSIFQNMQQRLAESQLAQQGSQFDRSLGLDYDKFNYGKEQDALNRQDAASNASAANSRWEDEMAFRYQQQQQAEYNQMMQWLMSMTGGY